MDFLTLTARGLPTPLVHIGARTWTLDYPSEATLLQAFPDLDPEIFSLAVTNNGRWYSSNFPKERAI